MEDNSMKSPYRFKSYESFKLFLAQAPEESWLKKRDLGAGKNSDYVPVETQQALADFVFRDWQVVDERYWNMVNEVCCTVKITALPDYPNSEPIVFTGSAASPIQVLKGNETDLFPKGKIKNALEYNLPACRSRAIGNAFETLGNKFGRNSSRPRATNDYSFDLSYKVSEKDGRN